MEPPISPALAMAFGHSLKYQARATPCVIGSQANQKRFSYFQKGQATLWASLTFISLLLCFSLTYRFHSIGLCQNNAAQQMNHLFSPFNSLL